MVLFHSTRYTAVAIFVIILCCQFAVSIPIPENSLVIIATDNQLSGTYEVTTESSACDHEKLYDVVAIPEFPTKDAIYDSTSGVYDSIAGFFSNTYNATAKFFSDNYIVIIVGVIILLALFFAPILIRLLGFTAAGIAKGSYGAMMMASYAGFVAKGSIVAIFQSIGATGSLFGGNLGCLFVIIGLLMVFTFFYLMFM
jgi:hypothetical protein